MLPDHRDDRFEDQRHQQQAARAEEDVVRLEEVLQLHRCPVLHEGLRGEDDDQIRGEGREDLLRRRHGGLAVDIQPQMVRELREGHVCEDEVREGSHGREEEREEEDDEQSCFGGPGDGG